jgi:gliding motility-associated-like protein
MILSFTYRNRSVLRKILFLPLVIVFLGLQTYAFSEVTNPVIASVNINSCVGSITISVTDGTAPYSYVWRDSGGNDLGVNSFFIDSLLPGDYTVTVTDADGDDVTATYTITNPPDLVGSVIVNEVTCRDADDAQVIITMANGNPPYPWTLFNDDNGNQLRTGTGLTPIIVLSGLGDGNYRFEVEDLNGCTGTIYFTVTQPPDILDYNSANVTDATCFNSADGSISINTTGGWGVYSYRWIRVSDGAVVATNEDATGLAPGAYYLEISDTNPSGNACVINTVNYTVGSPPEIVPTASIDDALCNGDSNGSIDLSVSGGVAPYTYSWSNGATTQDISGLSAGNYTVTITDNSGCTDVATFTVGEPAVLAISPFVTDVDCFGSNSGSILSNVTGGTAPYTYSWSTGSTQQNLSGLSAGTYDLTVTDANGCSTTLTNIAVAQPASALAKASETLSEPSCFGGSDGSITIGMTGGTGPYSYAWSNGDTGATISGLSAGIYTVTATDANGCTYVESLTLNDPTPIATNPSLTPPSCSGFADGTISIAPTNGTGPYTISWSTGDTGPMLSGVIAGTYTVTVTDNGGCTISETITLSDPAPLNGNAIVNDISCSGVNDGSIFLGVTGGTAPYTYLWNTGATTNNIAGLPDGPYSVTITDANGCAITENYTIIDPAPLNVTSTQVDLVCRGEADGSIDITPAGGTAPYTYLWSNGATSEDVGGLTAGNYSVTVRDASNCNVTLNFTLTEPATVLDISGVSTNSTCNGSDNGTIDLTVTGGTAPYTYAWSHGPTTQDVTALAPGNYNVSVTDNIGCTKFLSFTVAEPAPIAGNPVVNNISCNGADDGAISLSVSGGTAPYTYAWADNGAETSNSRSGLSPGNYTVTITDSNGCTEVEMFTLSEPAVLSSSFTQADVNCFGESTGSIDLNVTGGTAPYTYAWSNGALSQDISGLGAGSYSVVVTDANGCTTSESIVINQPASALTVTGSAAQITCNGAADGIINITVAGGSAPYTYNWSNGSTSEDLSNLPAGTYNLTVTDNNGCTENLSFVITDPPVLNVTNATTNISCFAGTDGAIDLTLVGGEAPYSFAWSNGATTEDVSGLSAGSYTVNITDNRGCVYNETFTLSQPAPLNIAYTYTDVNCNGGSNGAIDVTVTGGTAPYTYAWDNGSTNEDISSLVAGNYTLIATDVNGCSIAQTITINEPAVLSTNAAVSDITCFGGANGSVVLNPTGGTAPYTYLWSNGVSSKDVFGLAAGTYSVTITDFNGCTTVENYTINEPAALQVTGTVNGVVCGGASNGDIDLNVTGGVGPYTYSWSNGASVQDLNALSQGVYLVIVTDANGCSETATFTVAGPNPIILNANVTDVSCNGNNDGSIDLSPNAGVAPYSFAWSNGATTEDVAGLAPGAYAVTVTDANGCSTTENYNIQEPLPLVINQVATGVTCFGADDGTIDVNVTGGSLPYTYTWSNGANTEDISNLAGGTYQLIVTDNRGCTVTQDIVVDAPTTGLDATVNIIDATCAGQPGGQIQVTPVGGTAPFTYAWSNGSTQEDQVGLFAGDYAVTITDAGGCTFSATYTVGEAAPLDIQFDVTPTSCFGDSDGEVRATPIGGTGPYSFVWSNGSTSQDLLGVTGGTYNLTVIDANGCSVTQSVVVDEQAELSVDIDKVDVLCKGDASGLIQLDVTGGSGVYSYSWDNGADAATLADLAAGVYNVVITDAGGCTATASIVITEPALALTATVTGTDALACFGDETGLLNAQAEGGVTPYTYLWSNGETTSGIGGLGAGTYTVSITDANNCLVQVTHTITQPAAPLTIETTGKFNLDCNGDDDGSITAVITGGTGSYDILWSTGDTGTSLDNLAPGDYTIRVRDDNGCAAESIVTISEPDVLMLQGPIINEIQCYNDRDGSIELNLVGGTGPFTYDWSNGESTKNLIGIDAGTYTVLVTDANGCQVQGTYTLTSPPVFDVAPTTTEVSCAGASDASIALNIEGGVAPIDILWSNGATTETITNLSAGSYEVVISDDNGCTIQQVFNVIDPTPVTIEADIVDANDCNNQESGSVNLTVSGGTGPYTYQWSNGATTQNIENVLPGTYVVEVTDALGCSTQGIYNVDQPEPIRIEIATQPYIDCDNRVTGMRVIANVTGGLGSYTYNWSGGQSTGSENLVLTEGLLTVEVIDERGCSEMNAIDITLPELAEADFFYDALSLDETGELAIKDPVSFFDASLGDVVDWQWDFGDGFNSSEIDPIHVYDAEGQYTVTLTITDRLGCTSEKREIVDVKRGFDVMFPDAFTPNGDGRNDYFRPEMRGLVEVQLLIFNTWGEVIWTTTNPESRGWNGEINGREAENGNYVYKLIGRSFNGIKIEENGVFALLK